MMTRHSSSSAEESLLMEQTRKLFAACDAEGRGYIGKTDLAAIADLIPDQQMAALEKRIGDTFVDEKQFADIMQALVADSRDSSAQSDRSPSPQGFSGGLTLAEELLAVGPRQPIHDPVTEMIRQQLDDNCYPYSVKNPTSARDDRNNITIKKPHFRPIEPDAFSKVVPAQSLADELHEAEMGSPGQSNNEMDVRTPDRIFKVVFVGDSAVGKTCFLHRFCHNRFKPLFNATIGVDFTVKTIPINDRLVALQLWDTAGQERFRAITKQYFRKADGVVLMFDVTSEQSLLNVRNWVDSVRAGVDDTSVIALVGNKVDLFGNDSARTAVYKAGKRLAEEFGMSFHETSAFTGFGIDNCMKAIAERLQQREEFQLEEALKLEMMPQDKKRSWCCL